MTPVSGSTVPVSVVVVWGGKGCEVPDGVDSTVQEPDVMLSENGSVPPLPT